MQRNTSIAVAGVSSLMLLLAVPKSEGCGQGGSLSVTNLPFTPDFTVNLVALNAAGQIGGTFQAPGDSVLHGFIDTAGNSVDVGNLGGSITHLRALNAAGVAVGDSQNSDGSQTFAFLYDGANILNLGTLGGGFSTASGINDAGVVVGAANVLGDAAQQAFIYSNGVMTSLGDLGGGNSSATAINNNGVVIGTSLDTNSNSRGFVYLGSMLDLGDLGAGTSTTPFALNDAGLIVGESAASDGNNHAFKYQAGVMTDLGTLGGVSSSASAVNASGQIIGTWTAADSSTHGFIHSSGVTSDLGDLGGNYALPHAINNQGQVVGDTMTADDSLFPHAFLWQTNTMVDLNSLLPTNSAWLLLSAQFINDNGHIIGYGFLGADFTEFELDLGTGGSGTPPTAVIASGNQTVTCGAQVTLDGSGSTSSGGGSLTYLWMENNAVLSTNAILTASLPVGTNLVSLTVIDSCGDSNSISTMVLVVDKSKPSISGPANLSASADANCQAAVPNLSSLVTVSDSCTPVSKLIVVQNPPAGTLVGSGKTTITTTVTDLGGNTASLTTTFTVSDTTPPVIIGGPAPVTVPVGSNGQGAVPNIASQIVAVDNCTPATSLQITQSPLAGTLLSTGVYTMIITAKDAAGNTTQGSTSFRIADITPPVFIFAPASLSANVDSHCHATVPNVLSQIKVSDNVTPADKIVLKQNPVAGTILSKGNYTIVVTATDAAGNTSTRGIPFSVVDKIAPCIQSISANPKTLTATGQFVPVTVTVVATDNCDTPVSKITKVTSNDPANGVDWQITGSLTLKLLAQSNPTCNRTYTITVTTTDSSGNSTSANVTVSVPRH